MITSGYFIHRSSHIQPNVTLKYPHTIRGTTLQGAVRQKLYALSTIKNKAIPSSHDTPNGSEHLLSCPSEKKSACYSVPGHRQNEHSERSFCCLYHFKDFHRKRKKMFNTFPKYINGRICNVVCLAHNLVFVRVQKLCKAPL